MKISNILIPFLFCIVISLAGSCKKADYISCNSDRAVDSTMTDTEGTITNSGSLWYIQVGESKRFGPCNWKEGDKVDQQKVIFSGKVLRIRPNERLASTPFELAKMTKVTP